MKIAKDKLLLVIQKVLPSIETKGIVEEMGHLVFDGQYVLGYNDKIGINYPIGDESIDLNCGVVAADFLAAIKGIRTKEIDLEEGDNAVTISGGKAHSTIPFYDPKRIIELHESLKIEETLDSFQMLPEGFIDGLRGCKFSAADNLDNIKGMFAIQIQRGQIFSTNGYQATRYMTEEVDFGQEVIYIQKTFIDAIVNFEPTSAFFNSQWAYFQNEDQGILCCRVVHVHDKYPQNVENAFPDKDVTDGFKFVDGLEDELNSLAFFSEGKADGDKTIDVDIDKDGIAVLSAHSERGEMTVETEVKGYEGEGVRFNINPGYLKEFLGTDGVIIILNTLLCLRTQHSDHLAALRVRQ